MNTPAPSLSARLLLAAALVLPAACAPAAARPTARRRAGRTVPRWPPAPWWTCIRWPAPSASTSATPPPTTSPGRRSPATRSPAPCSVRKPRRPCCGRTAGWARRGTGIQVWDAYRPVRATRAMVAWAERTGNRWVIEQGYVAERSGHNRGGTVDVTLIRRKSGREAEMGTPYDHFSPAAHTANGGGQVTREPAAPGEGDGGGGVPQLRQGVVALLVRGRMGAAGRPDRLLPLIRSHGLNTRVRACPRLRRGRASAP